ncbi:hypothetical protein IQ07DRAFT_640142 [Pyrenochaeta sp. DS3sAY3a]|nr:hypothetical protein IQ07DRAFT_640142 [Pyrenochaeta sp. DS3sAY3a]
MLPSSPAAAATIRRHKGTVNNYMTTRTQAQTIAAVIDKMEDVIITTVKSEREIDADNINYGIDHLQIPVPQVVVDTRDKNLNFSFATEEEEDAHEDAVRDKLVMCFKLCEIEFEAGLDTDRPYDVTQSISKALQEGPIRFDISIQHLVRLLFHEDKRLREAMENDEKRAIAKYTVYWSLLLNALKQYLPGTEEKKTRAADYMIGEVIAEIDKDELQRLKVEG